MAKKSYVLGIDFGTLSGRALLVDLSDGSEAASEVHVYEQGVITSRLPGSKTRLEPDTALQDPRDYLEVLRRTVPRVLARAKIAPSQVKGLGVDFTASSPMACYACGTPLCFDRKWSGRPHAWVKLWKHHAAQPEADFINEMGLLRNERFITAYGGRYSSEWFFSKLLQVVNDDPEIYDACERWIEAGDWVVWQLTGRETRSVCGAGYKAMWVYPYGNGWAYPSPGFFHALHPKLSNVFDKLCMNLQPLAASAGGLSREGARLTGLKEGTPVAAGLIDAHAAVPATTVVTPGKMVLIMGTSTCNMILGDDFRPVEGMCGAVRDGIVPGYWGYEAGQAAVGDILAWYVEKGAPADWKRKADKAGMDLHQYLSFHAAEKKVGEGGLLALDWWNGNRSVLMDSTLSGCLFGLTLSTEPPDIYRALVEATAFGQRRIMEAFEAQGMAAQEIFACGGLAGKNEFLMQVYADVLGRAISVAATDQPGALGSAIYAAVAAGIYPDLRTAAGKMARIRERHFEPNGAHHERYDLLYTEYLRLHDIFGRHAVPTMRQLRQLRQGH
ncbi:MAG: ribulokinase [Verrucomicrobiae bacterium]|nr:ribulokinase [Verrucomicrobiae bacterium]